MAGIEDQIRVIVDAIGHLRTAVTRIDNREVAEQARGVRNYAFAGLPASSASNRGWVVYVTNGLKMGELTGAGTGVTAYSDGTAWRRTSDDTTVAA